MLAFLIARFDHFNTGLLQHADLLVYIVIDGESLVNVESRGDSCLDCGQAALVAHIVFQQACRGKL